VFGLLLMSLYLAMTWSARIEVHPRHLVLSSLQGERVLPLDVIADVRTGRLRLTFVCTDGQDVRGPIGVGAWTWLYELFGCGRTARIIDDIRAAIRRLR
jgi:hypothetical protein